ncbi:MAG: DUF2786 domain-containing protein [Acidimicrobiales bacterium]
MGVRNKERRRAKKQRREARDRQRNAGPGRPHPFGGFSGFLPYMVDRLVMDAAHAHCEDREPGPELDKLTDRGAGTGWCALVTARVAAALTEHATLALASGWEPRDVSAIVRRKLTVAAANLTEAVLAEAVRRRQPRPLVAARWEEQVAGLAPAARALDVASPSWEADVSSAVGAIGFLAQLRPLPELAAPARRHRPRPDLDPAVLDKVRGLLAKAEATAFEEEADAFLSKAQELMTRHNLDRAAVEEATEGAGAGAGAGVEARRCWLDDPYLKQKGLLLAVVARANRCRTVSLYEYGFVTVFGHPDDLTTTELLFTALLVHATNQMTLPLRQRKASSAGAGTGALERGLPADRDAWEALLKSMGRRDASRPSYRRSFLLAYATRIGARLREAAAAATEAAVATAGDALLPVLANRERGVDEAVAKMFPDTTTSEFTVTDDAGWAAGRAAADLADLSWQPKLAGAMA